MPLTVQFSDPEAVHSVLAFIAIPDKHILIIKQTTCLHIVAQNREWEKIQQKQNFNKQLDGICERPVHKT